MKKGQFAFKTSFSLAKLINFWEKKSIEAADGCERDFAASVVKRVKNTPELNGVIEDYSVLQKHSVLMESLTSAIIPSAYTNTNLQAIVPAGDFKAVYSTKRFHDYFCDSENNIGFDLNLSEDLFVKGANLANYSAILIEGYKIVKPVAYPIIRRITDKHTGLDRYFKMNMDNRFIEIKIHGPLPELTKNDITLLFENILNVDLWKEIVPPELFSFEGFLVLNMFEVTDQEAVSMLKQDLLKKNIFNSSEGFTEIERRIQTIFRNPALKLGIAAIPNDSGRLLNAGHKVGSSFLMNEECVAHCKNFKGSIYERAFSTHEPQIIYDLDAFMDCSPVEKAIAVQGIKNILVVGLKNEGKYIGVLELGSPEPGDINSINAIKLLDVLPLFSVALQRSLEDIENKIQAIIKEKCTAVHPSVEWRFRKAAYNLIEKEKQDEYSLMEDIVFRDVYPIYALSDIRNSSVTRNHAIQSDLKHNLLLARDIVKESNSVKAMPVLELMNYRIEEKILMLDSGLHSGDETSIINFLKREVEPLFRMVSSFGGKVEKAIIDYRNAIDPGLGFYYNKRRDYEESVQMINEEISAYVDGEEVKAQEIFPHYFEKYKTDGIEYTIYIGGSIAEQKEFDELYLKNIRVWQLLMMCNIARKSEELKSKLKVKLELAHLVLAQSNPLSIRFHFDQKKFDVDGTYNVHYEILKKRIDKAEIKGSGERLTQPGKLAIVYSQPSEANEYRQYIHYLQARGYFEEGIEDLELKDLQGVYGLRALRVAINLLPVKLKQDMDINKILSELEKSD